LIGTLARKPSKKRITKIRPALKKTTQVLESVDGNSVAPL
jgi:hypothetical protein